MTSVRRRSCPTQKNQVSKAFINKSNNEDLKKPLGSNKSKPFKALTGLESPAELF